MVLSSPSRLSRLASSCEVSCSTCGSSSSSSSLMNCIDSGRSGRNCSPNFEYRALTTETAANLSTCQYRFLKIEFRRGNVPDFWIIGSCFEQQLVVKRLPQCFVVKVQCKLHKARNINLGHLGVIESGIRNHVIQHIHERLQNCFKPVNRHKATLVM